MSADQAHYILMQATGIYSDAGYTQEDQQAASLFHDLDEQWDSGKLGRDERFVKVADEPLNPNLVALCANTTIHADKDGWIRHVGNECPVSDGDAVLEIKIYDGKPWQAMPAKLFAWDLPLKNSGRITHWRYHKK